MPYIRESLRPTMDTVVEQMVKAGVQVDGDLNYILFKFCKYNVPKNYNSIKNYIGELNETIAEIRRKILADYEDLKEEENGSI